jgi:hypothetical protein
MVTWMVVGVIWVLIAACAVFFIRGATAPEILEVAREDRDRQRAAGGDAHRALGD